MENLDVPLLRKAVEWVLEQDKLALEDPAREWEQGTWGEGKIGRAKDAVVREGQRYRPVVDCGTSCCVAGKICLLAGDQFVWQDDGERVRAGTVIEVDEVITEDGRVMDIDDRAIELLGVKENEAYPLFSGGNSASGLLLRARGLAAKHGEELGL